MSENLFGIVTRCLNYLAYRRGDRDKHPGRSGGDTLKANDGENTKTTTGGFDPDGPNLDYDIELNQGGRRRPQRRQQATHGPRSEHGAVVGRTKRGSGFLPPDPSYLRGVASDVATK